MSFTQLTVVPPPEAKNRRAHPRRRSEKRAILPIDNGGILLDICEGGLNFQGVAGLMDGEPCRLRFILPDTTQSIEVSGKVAWLNSSRKGGGLRFVNLSEAALGQIREWIAEETPSGAAAEPLLLEAGSALQGAALPVTSPVASFEERPSASFSRAQIPAKSEWRRRAKPAGRSSHSVFTKVAALLILLFATAVLVGGSPFDKLAALVKGMGKAGVMEPAASPAVGAAQNFQVEAGYQQPAVDLDERERRLRSAAAGNTVPRSKLPQRGADPRRAGSVPAGSQRGAG